MCGSLVAFGNILPLFRLNVYIFIPIKDELAYAKKDVCCSKGILLEEICHICIRTYIIELS